MTKTKSAWCIVVFEGEHREYDGEVAYVKGPFSEYKDAIAWAENEESRADGEFKWQITHLDI